MRRRGPVGAWILSFLVLSHGLLLWYSVHIHGPVYDEVGHLAAGLRHWLEGNFVPYHQDPPFVRLLATGPIVLFTGREHISMLVSPESGAGLPGSPFEVSPGLARGWLRTARKVCTLFSVAGLLGCYVWARSLARSPVAGLVAAATWAYSPLVLANGSLFLEDVPCAALSLWAAIAFDRWYRYRTVGAAAAAGLLAGLALATKFTAVLVLAALLLAWLALLVLDRRRPRLQDTIDLALLLTIALFTVNAMYAFKDSFVRLDRFRFTSGLLAGQISQGQRGGNRFAGSWVGRLPVPVPAQYLIGMDFQRREFERKYWSYLRGEWRLGGWWYFYLYALSVKEPIGTLGLLILGGLAGLRRLTANNRLTWVILPAVVVLAIVSAHTGINRHVRYVLPAIPFLIVLASVGLAQRATTRWLAAALCSLSAAATLYVAPHFHAHFNLLAGGPAKGPRHLLFSAIDYGEDLLVLSRWLRRHPAIVLDGVTCEPNVTRPSWHGLPDRSPPAVVERLRPGWYAVTVMTLYYRDPRWKYFRMLKPYRHFGWTVYLYLVTTQDIRRLRAVTGSNGSRPLRSDIAP